MTSERLLFPSDMVEQAVSADKCPFCYGSFFRGEDACLPLNALAQHLSF